MYMRGDSVEAESMEKLIYSYLHIHHEDVEELSRKSIYRLRV